MERAKRLWRWIRRILLGASIPVWAALFYHNYWLASMPAFGDPSAYMAELQVLLVKYSTVGAVLLLASIVEWQYGSGMRRRGAASTQRELG
ncbi:MAG: hypothetical protein WC340_17990 [Kiritimatiellia bacterium]